jgi:hypothetical protein
MESRNREILMAPDRCPEAAAASPAFVFICDARPEGSLLSCGTAPFLNSGA